MEILSVVLLVFFVIIAVLLILLVLAQNEEGDNLGGIFAGGSGTAFGSRSGNVLTRATTVLGTLFLIISLGMALLSKWRTSSLDDLASTGVGTSGLPDTMNDLFDTEGDLTNDQEAPVDAEIENEPLSEVNDSLQSEAE